MLQRFANDVYKQKYGLKLPLVGAESSTIHTKIDSRRQKGMSWLDGVLPFYAASQRDYGNSKQNSFLDFVFSQRRCSETFFGKGLRDYACFFDKNKSISVVVPWLGHDYSFLRPDNFKKLDYESLTNGISFSDMPNVAMGTDMCIEEAGKIIACSATSCIDPSYDLYEENKTLCQYSRGLDKFYKSELPGKFVREHLEKLHPFNNLYNPIAPRSQCYIKYNTVEEDLSNNRQCIHRQAPLGYRPQEILGRARPAISLNRTRVHMQSNSMFKDVFRAQTTRYRSLWNGDSVANTVANPDKQLYDLLAVHPNQLSPTQIKLKIAGDGEMLVEKVGLFSLQANLRWTRDLYTTVNEDLQRVHSNPIYVPDCSSPYTSSLASCVRKPHWSCPYVLTSLFGGSSKARRTNPHIKLLTPDPVRMRRLYPDLDGVHPVIRTRDIVVGAGGDAVEYSQFGAVLFIANPLRHTVLINARAEINLMMKMFFLGQSVKTFTVRTPVSNKKMDWPDLNYILRSSESMLQDVPPSATDVSHKFGDFFATVKKLELKRKTAGPVTSHNRTSGGNTTTSAKSRFYGGSVESTLDPGGDCYRAPLIQMNRSVLHIVLNSDVCYLRGPQSNTRRLLECTNAGRGLPITINVSTTSRRSGRIKGGFPKSYLPTKCNDISTPSTVEYHWNAATSKFSSRVVENEISLSTRMRVSPLWTLLNRLENINTLNHLTPSTVWMETNELRLSNPRWHTTELASRSTAASARQETVWDTNWILKSTDPNCQSDAVGTMSESTWNNNANRGGLCFDVFNVPEHTDACMKTIVNPFSICQIKEFEDFCRVVGMYRNDIMQINAWANGITKSYKNLYVSSLFLREDGIFGWHAVVQTYSGLGLDVGQCGDVNDFVQLAQIKMKRRFAYECPSQSLFQLSVMVSGIRTVLMRIVTMVVIVVDMMVDLLFLIISIFSNNQDAIKSHANGMFKSFMLLLEELAKFFEEMMNLIFNFLQKTFFNEILLLIEKICEFAKIIVKALLGFVDSILKFFEGIAKGLGLNSRAISDARIEMKHLKANVDKWNCVIDRKNVDTDLGDDHESLMASTCWIQQSFFTMPSDFLGGLVGDFTCGPTSMCLLDLADTENVGARLCMKCDENNPGNIGGYGCDLATKQCTCGVRPMTSSNCISTRDCLQAGSVCDIYSVVYSASFGTQPCLESQGSSFCQKDSPHTGMGTCATYRQVSSDFTATCSNVEINVLVKPVHSSKFCLGTTENIATSDTVVDFDSTFIFNCVRLSGANELRTGCLQVLQTLDLNTVERFVTYDIRIQSSQAQRRILSHEFGNGELVMFLLDSQERVPAITGMCSHTLTECIQNTPDQMQSPDYSSCMQCLRLWWFWNSTLTRIDCDHSLVDTELLDFRQMIIGLVNNAHVLPYLATTAPGVLVTLFQEWLRDDIVFATLMAYANLPVVYLSLLFEKALHIPESTSYLQFLHHGTEMSKDNGSSHSPMVSNRHLLESKIAGVDLSAHSAAEMSDRGMTKPGSRHLLQKKVAGIDLSIFQISDQSIERIMDNAKQNAANFPDKRKVIQDMFDSGTGFSCIIDYGVLFNSIIHRFANFLQRDGWRAKRTCSRLEMRQISTQDILCPVVMKPVERLLYNTNVLIKYYQYMALSSCLQNMSVSCLPPALFQVSGAYESIPSVDTGNVSVPEVDTVEKRRGRHFLQRHHTDFLLCVEHDRLRVQKHRDTTSGVFLALGTC